MVCPTAVGLIPHSGIASHLHRHERAWGRVEPRLGPTRPLRPDPKADYIQVPGMIHELNSDSETSSTRRAFCRASPERGMVIHASSASRSGILLHKVTTLASVSRTSSSSASTPASSIQPSAEVNPALGPWAQRFRAICEALPIFGRLAAECRRRAVPRATCGGFAADGTRVPATRAPPDRRGGREAPGRQLHHRLQQDQRGKAQGSSLREPAPSPTTRPRGVREGKGGGAAPYGRGLADGGRAHAADIMDLADLTPGERRELMNMAQGVPSKNAAIEGGVSIDSITVCRTRIFKKLGAWR
jgi:DNA-binding CsgD family transcriptional regulator